MNTVYVIVEIEGQYSDTVCRILCAWPDKASADTYCQSLISRLETALSKIPTRPKENAGVPMWRKYYVELEEWQAQYPDLVRTSLGAIPTSYEVVPTPFYGDRI